MEDWYTAPARQIRGRLGMDLRSPRLSDLRQRTKHYIPRLSSLPTSDRLNRGSMRMEPVLLSLQPELGNLQPVSPRMEPVNPIPYIVWPEVHFPILFPIYYQKSTYSTKTSTSTTKNATGELQAIRPNYQTDTVHLSSYRATSCLVPPTTAPKATTTTDRTDAVSLLSLMLCS